MRQRPFDRRVKTLVSNALAQIPLTGLKRLQEHLHLKKPIHLGGEINVIKEIEGKPTSIG